MHFPGKGTLFLLFWNQKKKCIWKKIVKKKCEKSVPGKKIVKKSVKKSVPGKNSEKNSEKKSVKKVYLEKEEWKKCTRKKNSETNREKSVPGKRIVKQIVEAVHREKYSEKSVPGKKCEFHLCHWCELRGWHGLLFTSWVTGMPLDAFFRLKKKHLGHLKRDSKLQTPSKPINLELLLFQ